MLYYQQCKVLICDIHQFSAGSLEVHSHEQLSITSGYRGVDVEGRFFLLLLVSDLEVVDASLEGEKLSDDGPEFVGEAIEGPPGPFLFNGALGEVGEVVLVTVLKDICEFDVPAFQMGEFLVIDDLVDASLEMAVQENLEIFDVDLLIDSVDDLLQHQIDVDFFALFFVYVLVVHVHDLVEEGLLAFVEIDEFKRTAKEEGVLLACYCQVQVPLHPVQLHAHQQL